MSATLKVRIRRSEGCLLRVLGQIGRRGYEVLAVSARLSEDGKIFEMTVDFEPFIPMPPTKPRPVEVLPALVAKLVEVVSVELTGVPKAAPGRPEAKPKAPKPAGERVWED